MKFKYQPARPELGVIDSLPRVPLTLRFQGKQVEITGIVDSGATINVLPFHVGRELGAEWDERKAKLKLAGNLQDQPAIPFLVMAQLGNYEPVKLSFA